MVGDETALLTMPSEFSELRNNAMKAYRGQRTIRYTYVRNLDGAWLLYDNGNDPYQMNNLAGNPQYTDIQMELERRLQQRLNKLGDKFLEGRVYLKQDGLNHYKEVNEPCIRLWKDHWKKNL